MEKICKILGCIQEEARSLDIPALVLRDTTERPEGIEAGTLKLARTDEESHIKIVKYLNSYDDGEASRRIVEAILSHFEK